MSHNLYIYLTTLTNLTYCNKELSPFIKIEHGTDIASPSTKKNLNHEFNFPMELPFLPETEIVFKVKNAAKKTVGQVILQTTDLIEDIVYEKQVEISAIKEKNGVTGVLSFRMLISRKVEERMSAQDETFYYNYEAVREAFKSGDLVLFSGRRYVDCLQKIRSGSLYSSVGMVVCIPNKYTHHDEMFLLEVTADAGYLPDAFSRSREAGIRVFKLFDRLHYYYGGAIWYLPLKKALNVTRSEKLKQWINHVVEMDLTELSQPKLKPHEHSFLSKRGITSKKIAEQGPLLSALFCLQGLNESGVTKGKIDLALDSESLFPSKFTELKVFHHPVLIKAAEACFPELEKKRNMKKFESFVEGRIESTYGYSRDFANTMPYLVRHGQMALEVSDDSLDLVED